MTKRIFQTIIVRGGVALLNMVIVFLTLNVLGADGRGKISLFLTDLMLITMLTNVLGGSAVSYHVPKTNIQPLLKLGIVWVVLVSVLVGGILNYLHSEYLQKHLILIAILHGFVTINQMVLIGKQRINTYNLVFVMDPLFRVLVLLVGFYGFKVSSLQVFVVALYVALGISLLVSSYFVYRISVSDERTYLVRAKDVLKYGLGTELSSLVQFFNYRLLFYVVYYQLGATTLGWFSVAVSITESLWIISRSITVNQYAKILNTTKKTAQRFLTNKSARLSFVLTLASILALLLVPNKIWNLVIHKDVSQIHRIIMLLCPGVLLIAVSNVWGHYFSGRGNYQINNLKSLIGLGVMLLGAYFLIPVYKVMGVVLAMTLGYVASSLTLLFFYVKDKS